jgi:hypothetical protein
MIISEREDEWTQAGGSLAEPSESTAWKRGKHGYGKVESSAKLNVRRVHVKRKVKINQQFGTQVFRAHFMKFKLFIRAIQSHNRIWVSEDHFRCNAE